MPTLKEIGRSYSCSRFWCDSEDTASWWWITLYFIWWRGDWGCYPPIPMWWSSIVTVCQSQGLPSQSQNAIYYEYILQSTPVIVSSTYNVPRYNEHLSHRVAKQLCKRTPPLLVLNHGNLYESYLCMLYSVLWTVSKFPIFELEVIRGVRSHGCLTTPWDTGRAKSLDLSLHLNLPRYLLVTWDLHRCAPPPLLEPTVSDLYSIRVLNRYVSGWYVDGKQFLRVLLVLWVYIPARRGGRSHACLMSPRDTDSTDFFFFFFFFFYSHITPHSPTGNRKT